MSIISLNKDVEYDYNSVKFDCPLTITPTNSLTTPTLNYTTGNGTTTNSTTANITSANITNLILPNSTTMTRFESFAITSLTISNIVGFGGLPQYVSGSGYYRRFNNFHQICLPISFASGTGGGGGLNSFDVTVTQAPPSPTNTFGSCNVHCSGLQIASSGYCNVIGIAPPVQPFQMSVITRLAANASNPIYLYIIVNYAT